jgi:hypothetical protein
MTKTISNSDDVIDSRDVIARIEELRDEREALVDALTEATDELANADEDADREAMQTAIDDARQEVADWDEENAEELKQLQAVAEQAEGYASDWRHGATLIRESYFKTYAQELADDIGAIDRNAAWPLSHIDWEAAADELKSDYTSIDYDGTEYWVR